MGDFLTTVKNMIRALREDAKDEVAPPVEEAPVSDLPPGEEVMQGEGDPTGLQPALGNGMAQQAAQAMQERNRRLRELDQLAAGNQ